MFALPIARWIASRRLTRSFSASARSLSSPFTTMAASYTVNTTERLLRLRQLMSQDKNNVQALVVPSEDQHSSEYLADCDKRRAFISGFTGSAGCAVITLQNAYIFTDGRYFLQAEKQLDSNWTLMKQGLPDVPTWQEFLSKNLEQKTSIGIDARLISAADSEKITAALTPKESKLVPLEKNLVDEVWQDRPPRPQNSVFHLDEKYAGQSFKDKVQKVREELSKKKHPALVITMLDEIAWLFNLRGSDIEYNPVFFAYAIVTSNTVELFIEKAKLDESALKYLGVQVKIHPYEDFFARLEQLPANLALAEESKVLISENASLAVASALGKDKFIVSRSPVNDLKAIKNATELEGFRQSHIRDGAALVRYFAWLEEQLDNGVRLDECQGADQLEAFRKEGDLFRGLSFDTISSTGPNGAIIHYKPEPSDCAIIKKDQIYLCDSGAQYYDGTTDVTRTWHFGTPTDEEKRAFTRVLQGHIAIDTAVFPNGTTGYVIDSYARRALWQDGLDYRHGTGHGVGHYLNVHEGPHGIGTRITLNSTPLKAGMTLSNEPGYYADGRFGIRIENIVLVKEVKTPNNFGDKGYLGFENVTMCPIQTKLVDTALLATQERTWLNDYHKEVWSKVSPLLKKDQRALKWLEKECLAI